MKTIKDAVIEFEGKRPKKSLVGWAKNYPYEGGVSSGYKFNDSFICSHYEFNAYVELLASNIGRANQTYAEYKSEWDYAQKLKLKYTKPVYTQAMASHNINPIAGMKASHDCSKYGYESCREWEEVLVVGSYDGEIFFRKQHCASVFATSDLSRFKPVDQRTNKEKAIDDIVIRCGFDEHDSIIATAALLIAYDKWCK